MKCVCDSSVKDEREETLQFEFGPFKSQCVDTCRFRRAFFLKNEKTKLVANVLHKGKYWTATIPKNAIEEVDAAFENFLSGISHVILRFRFSKPIKLALQGNKNGKPQKEQTEIHDLVLSAEGVPPKGHQFSFVESATGQYLLAYRMLSIEDTVTWMIFDKKHSVRQFKLDLNADTRERVFDAGLNLSQASSFNTIYQLFTNNCATSAIDLIDKEHPYHHQWNDWLDLVYFQRAVPVSWNFGTLYALGKRGLINEKSELPKLEDEASKLKKL
jgi:hypothetical protein